MKKILLFGLLLIFFTATNAQDNTLAPDQNPNYKQSLDKYKSQSDKLLATMNTTVQDTYKAYDWYEAKMERRHQRIEDRRERRLYRLQNLGYYYNPYNYYYDPFDTPYRYSPYHFHRYGWRHW